MRDDKHALALTLTHQFSRQINVTLVTHTFCCPVRSTKNSLMCTWYKMYKQSCFFSANMMMDENCRFRRIDFLVIRSPWNSLKNFAHGSWFKMLLVFLCSRVHVHVNHQSEYIIIFMERLFGNFFSFYIAETPMLL